MKPARIHVGVDCYSQPTWVPDDAGQLLAVEPDTLPLSPSLIEALNAWAVAYTATFGADGDPAPDDSPEMQRLDERGLQLWQDVVKEVGDRFEVHYDSPIHGQSHRVHRPPETRRS